MRGTGSRWATFATSSTVNSPHSHSTFCRFKNETKASLSDPMAFSDYLPSVVVPLLLLAGAWLAKKYKPTPHLPFPPGPKPSFIIGNLRDLPCEQQWLTFTEWGKQYGDIVHASAFGDHVVVVSSLKVAADLFEKRARIYSDRPSIAMLPLMGWDFNFGLMPYGEKWRQYRRLFHQHFRQDAAVEFRPIQLRKIHDSLGNLLNTPEDFSAHMKSLAAAIIMSTIYGYEIESTDDRFVDLADNANKRLGEAIFPGGFAVNTFPFLRHLPSWFPGGSFQRYAQDTVRLVDEMKDAPFNFVRQNMRDGVGNLSMLARLLDQHDGSKEQEKVIKEVTAVAYSAAADTTAATLDAFIMSIALNPDVAQKAQKELDAVTGQSRLPSFEDRSDLPYCQAVYREVLRKWPAVPLGVPHANIQDDIYEGYFIPKGTAVISNIWAMGRDESVYPNSEEFNPERFLNADGQFQEVDDVLAFGFGRRICPGRYTADASVWAAIVSILASFDIAKAKDAAGKEIEIKPAFSDKLVCHARPFRCSITPRSNIAKRLIEEAMIDL
ncbi:cytochrome P450 [Mycena polygramma]|nr:cytochrome P450 [Mycena polygramma]